MGACLRLFGAEEVQTCSRCRRGRAVAIGNVVVDLVRARRDYEEKLDQDGETRPRCASTRDASPENENQNTNQVQDAGELGHQSRCPRCHGQRLLVAGLAPTQWILQTFGPNDGPWVIQERFWLALGTEVPRVILRARLSSLQSLAARVSRALGTEVDDDCVQPCDRCSCSVSPPAPPAPPVECQICYDLKERNKFVELRCGHNDYCLACFRNYISSRGNEVSIPCVKPDCKEKIAHFELRKYMTRE